MTLSLISLFFVFSYLIGSIPSSYIFGKVTQGIDIREHGSGNAGATNALRVLGVKIGIITMICDMLKGFLPVFVGKILLGKYFTFSEEVTSLILIGIALSAIIGHIFTIYLNFKGGKGVATSAGVFIGLTPLPLLIALIVFIATVWISRYVSLGSILASITLVAIELYININKDFSDVYYLIFVTLVALFIIIKHKSNIQRLIAGNENKISFGKK